MKLQPALLGLCLAALAAPSAAQEAAANGLPDWWRAHVEFMSRDGGVWVSPNPR